MYKIKDLKLHLDDRGYLYEILRTDDDIFDGFGQYYISAINPNTVKGFHLHYKQKDYIACVSGQIKLVLIDANILSQVTIKEFNLSPLNPKLIVIEPNIWHGWMCIGNKPALVINASSIPFDKNNPDEDKIDPHNNPWNYKWKVIDK